jgi:hypothetical protein
MQETARRSLSEEVITLHNIARTMEEKSSLSLRQEAYELRRVADRISHLESLEREERYRHTLPYTPNKFDKVTKEDGND